ncbi:hypothetical protein MX824_000089 [Vibrio parahaemolyticus]|nr:hypothetical protein [Vibrio parahaemolyticus]EJC6780345.1 hypothetical protein [Vibrio parahaemolyticus]EJC6794475.1 hypothetical protein [Vibrio parahaemolyticus]EJC6808694.1 hypothetical protein [Vibrio parahaemolyticus]EJC6856291.1 hypothetical protein [Vibrio parahaemolyticus]
MNKQELNFLNQYVNVRMPRNASEWTDHYAFLAVASGIDLSIIMKKVKILMNLNVQHQKLLRSDPEKIMKEFEEKRDDVFANASTYFTNMFGFDLTSQYDMQTVWNGLFSKFGKTKIVKRLYADEMIKVYNEIIKDRTLNTAYHTELKAIGVNADTIKSLLKSWTVKDTKESAQAYRVAYKQLESELVEYYKRLYSIDSESTLQNVKLENVVDRLIKSHYFDETDKEFNKYQFHALPDIMLIKLCFSQAINKTL